MLQGLFGRRPERLPPGAAVDALRAAVGAGDARAKDTITRSVASLRATLFDGGAPEEDVRALTRLACGGDVLELLARNLRLMEFETRKDAMQVFNHLVRRGAGGVKGVEVEEGEEVQVVSGTTVDVVARGNGALLTYLVDCYDDTEIALNTGAMLRECVRDVRLGKVLLESDSFWRFFELVEREHFDIASDAFTSFKDLLTRHQAVAAAFMVANLERFVVEYNGLLCSNNYYTRRQSLKLLGEMLIERANFRIMTQYISSAGNLKLVMNLLLDNRPNIQFEAFHVFKVFVANPNKPADVLQILLRNKNRLYEYLNEFLIDRDDEQFHVDRKRIIDEIAALS